MSQRVIDFLIALPILTFTIGLYVGMNAEERREANPFRRRY